MSDIWEVGKNYLIRTVTMIDTGRLVAVGEHELADPLRVEVDGRHHAGVGEGRAPVEGVRP